VLDSAILRNSSPVKLRDRSPSQRYEEKLQELRKERKAENKQVERLSSVLAKKASSAKAPGARRAVDEQLVLLLGQRRFGELHAAPEHFW
jgi:CDP-glycerol glycerophosphotransferase (TagB/SpsB family)